MASALRSTLLRQALVTPSSRLTTSAIPAFRTQQYFLRRAPLALQQATFQTSSKRAILPPLPQRMEGTVNDAVRLPPSEPSHGNYHWTFERLVSAALLPITIAPFAAGSLSPLLDGTFIGLIIVHTYIGFQSVIADYLPKWRVPFLRKAADWGNLLAVVVVGWGWYEFETNDVGLTEGVRRIWKAGNKTEILA
ncbi:membrane anchor subunit of succinate dehydrogenase, Sdh4 [Friedmanniomyces endolithicus]|nr:membrane anchor subunit of succinate dehydrogenase, Sdh4 [Friedmanniomyces endolithicus]KAK0311955.1 membrane anchor subunit of succinate dehydrogenase, Sdh4 [Friedmanniomyces endolithicus]KAK0832188.1 membrane anchor subunit of succinate dehydrogenase, Sdh4 [Friedmanniomyces endolithicus]